MDFTYAYNKTIGHLEIFINEESVYVAHTEKGEAKALEIFEDFKNIYLAGFEAALNSLIIGD